MLTPCHSSLLLYQPLSASWPSSVGAPYSCPHSISPHMGARVPPPLCTPLSFLHLCLLPPLIPPSYLSLHMGLPLPHFPLPSPLTIYFDPPPPELPHLASFLPTASPLSPHPASASECSCLSGPIQSPLLVTSIPSSRFGCFPPLTSCLLRPSLGTLSSFLPCLCSSCRLSCLAYLSPPGLPSGSLPTSHPGPRPPLFFTRLCFALPPLMPSFHFFLLPHLTSSL